MNEMPEFLGVFVFICVCAAMIVGGVEIVRRMTTSQLRENWVAECGHPLSAIAGYKHAGGLNWLVAFNYPAPTGGVLHVRGRMTAIYGFRGTTTGFRWADIITVRPESLSGEERVFFVRNITGFRDLENGADRQDVGYWLQQTWKLNEFPAEQAPPRGAELSPWSPAPASRWDRAPAITSPTRQRKAAKDEGGNPMPPLEVTFLYPDGDGEPQVRRVTMRGLNFNKRELADPWKLQSFTGYCHTRNAVRRFSFRKVQGFRLVADGREIDDPATWLTERYGPRE